MEHSQEYNDEINKAILWSRDYFKKPREAIEFYSFVLGLVIRNSNMDKHKALAVILELLLTYDATAKHYSEEETAAVVKRLKGNA